MSDEEIIEFESENARKLVAERIWDAMTAENATARGDLGLIPDFAEGSGDNGQDPDEEQILEETYSCLRWYEIKQYFIDNSALIKLAILTMGMLSELVFL
jgi:hypothetical protein